MPLYFSNSGNDLMNFWQNPFTSFVTAAFALPSKCGIKVMSVTGFSLSLHLATNAFLSGMVKNSLNTGRALTSGISHRDLIKYYITSYTVSIFLLPSILFWTSFSSFFFMYGTIREGSVLTILSLSRMKSLYALSTLVLRQSVEIV